ncbi:MAG: putative zinc-binding metallopeptidase [Isosphaeraceae bacterium]
MRESATATPIRDLGLTIKGSPLEPILEEFAGELRHAGIHRVRPRFYLSTEWGVNEGTIAIAIPFYLARPDLVALHDERVGHVEGNGPSDILRYLRHEMGHVVNYAYTLFETPEWIETFGPMDHPYLDEYRLGPFSRRFVRHLPGWYAQKHPDEDWSETFAVWMTPGLDWHADYQEWPEALAKLQYCARTMAALADRAPLVTADDLDEDVSEIAVSLDAYYQSVSGPVIDEFHASLDAPLRALFPTPGPEHVDGPVAPASHLLRSLEGPLVASVYQWTGHFPERTRPLLRHLANRADALRLVYPESAHARVIVSLTTLVTALATNHVQRGTYFV